MAIKLILSSEEILNKVFQPAPKGYSPLDVDSFLDGVIKDYKIVEANLLLKQSDIDALNKKIEELESKVKVLEIENNKYKSKVKNMMDDDTVNFDNIDLKKRINSLELYLYKHGVDPNTIK